MSLDVERYLARIAYDGDRRPSSFALAELQLAHLRHVPFENLDIHRGRPLSLDIAALFDKVVTRQRGGFCYELNGLFAELLHELGYEVDLLAARVYDGEGTLGPERDHLALAVRCDGNWLVDVGFGEAFSQPLALDSDQPQRQQGRFYRVRRVDSRTLSYGESGDGDSFSEQYTFGLEPERLSDFEAMCRYHQSSPKSPFTRKQVCTRLTDGGRITVTADKIIKTRGDDRQTEPIRDRSHWRRALAEHFGIHFGTTLDD